MTSIVYVGYLVLYVVIVLMIMLVGISHVIILYNNNIILLIILVVVSSIFTFVGYYIGRDVSSGNFSLLKILFLGLMVLILISFRVLIFVRWEGIGVISICLIGY